MREHRPKFGSLLPLLFFNDFVFLCPFALHILAGCREKLLPVLSLGKAGKQDLDEL